MSNTIYLITGGAGNIGSALAQKLASDSKNHLVIIDNLLTGSIIKIPKGDNITFIKANVNNYNDVAAVFGRFNFDYVFHFAAVVGVKRTLENPMKVLDDIEGIKNILSLSKNTCVKRIYYSSSSEVYGEPFEIPQNEHTTPLNSKLPYAIVKNVSEAYLRSYQQEYNLDYTIFRFFNTYGPNQSEDFVIPKFIDLAIKNQNITIYGNGLQTRTFCYIDDNIDAILNIHFKALVKNDIINIGNDKEITILELAKLIIKKTNSLSNIVYKKPLKEGDMMRRCPDITKMKVILKRELLTVEEGVKKSVKFYMTKKNEDRC